MTDKERLEIIKFLRNSEKTVAPGMQPSELISRKDVDWLINRVEELEEEVEKQKNRKYLKMRQRDDFMKKAQRYKQALEFYADESNYKLYSHFENIESSVHRVDEDYGEKARQALGWEENK